MIFWLNQVLSNSNKRYVDRVRYDVLDDDSTDSSFKTSSLTAPLDPNPCKKRNFFGIGKLMLKWKGSVYKLIFKELTIYAMAYALISIIYRYGMDPKQRRYFESFCLYCERALELVPLSFVLGFYVTFVITRWWNQFSVIPWPDRLMHAIIQYLDGTDERSRILRRTLIRYVNLSSVILFQSISSAVKRYYPSFSHLVDAGFMTLEEKSMLESVHTSVNKHFVPMIWFINLLKKARSEGRITDSIAMKHLLQEVNEFRSKTGLLWCFDWVTVPLVYTQVVTLTTHLFFVLCLLGRQYLDPSKGYYNHHADFYFPFFTFFQFIFLMGWLKVAHQLINPFGDDDDDFETNWIIERNLQVSYIVVDELYGVMPTVVKDIHWNKSNYDGMDAGYQEGLDALNYWNNTKHYEKPPRYQKVVESTFSKFASVAWTNENLNSVRIKSSSKKNRKAGKKVNYVRI